MGHSVHILFISKNKDLDLTPKKIYEMLDENETKQKLIIELESDIKKYLYLN
jgi:hypothetical protein